MSEWLESEDSFHMMRDHPMHDIGMLGSAWGVKLNTGKSLSEALFFASTNPQYDILFIELQVH